MSITVLDSLAEEALTQLELEESELLSWGFLGGTFPTLERIEEILREPATPILAQLWEEAKAQGFSEIDVAENLVERRLIFGGTDRARSRYAETIRLLYLLKQRFRAEDWNTAPNLVSGMRLLPRYRRYPKRDQEWADIASRLEGEGLVNAIGLDTLGTLLEEGRLKLARFQTESLQTLLRARQQLLDNAVIIGAGTGSGKTKAFYLPAFAFLTESVAEDPLPWTRVLAIYPRNELLKDQLKESLLEIAKLYALLSESNLRPLSVGAYYGDTPNVAQEVAESPYWAWEKTEGGYICPFLLCPECGEKLIWPEEEQSAEVADNAQGRYGSHEVLHCVDCGTVIDGKRIILTRKRMELNPPDILFTTTEMLNRILGNVQSQPIFGVNTRKPPQFVLLDEVHIHSEVSGAQVAYLLRRWRHLVRVYHSKSVVHFVGLSATLTNPARFFARLTGVAEDQTSYITPDEEDLTEEGLEYNLVLRGDPISNTALLSTSVQTAMLLGRMLDPLKLDVSRGAWGKKIFGFTDKLDVINRWFHIELDAEQDKILSQYRDMHRIDRSTLEAQKSAGQVWPTVALIDPDALKTPLTLGITTSQAKGVDVAAKLVIATSTLEVGFNDPHVGAVLQHKAPRSMASFLQRKGRAGRTRGMRPWTVVITSAYGRDRWYYENPEQLFDPLLAELPLPLANSYVQHIQAAFAFMEWVGVNFARRGYKQINVWRVLASKGRGYYREEKRIIKEIILQAVTGNHADLDQFIGKALQLRPAELERVLWSPPRSLMLNLLPALLVQLDNDWKQQVENNRFKVLADEQMDAYPLSGFIPHTLFTALEAKDIPVYIPGRTAPEELGLKQTLSEFVPGNVSKRFANLYRKREAQWIPLPDTDEFQLADHQHLRVLPIDRIVVNGEPITVCMPYRMHLAILPPNLNDRSSAHLQWRVKMQPNGLDEQTQAVSGLRLSEEDFPLLRELMTSVEVFSGDRDQGVLCTRYATELRANVRYVKQDSLQRQLEFRYEQEPAGIGFQAFVDAIAWRYKKPALHRLLESRDWPQALADWRPVYYTYQLQNSPNLPGLTIFDLYWLSQICLSGVMKIAVSEQIDLFEAIEWFTRDAAEIVEEVLADILLAIAVQSPETDANATDEADTELENRRLYQRLLGLLRTPEVLDELTQSLSVLTEDLTKDNAFWNWLEERYRVTLAASLKAAIDALLPDVNTEDLLVDLVEDCIWFSEPDAGGMGVISKVYATMRTYPGKFEDLIRDALRTCPRHVLAQSLNALLPDLTQGEMADAFWRARSARTLDEQKDALVLLQHELEHSGLAPRRELISALNTKVLGPNTEADTDELTQWLHQIWHTEEKRLGCAIDSRVFSVAALQLSQIAARVEDLLRQSNLGGTPTAKQRSALLETFLWNDCRDACPECLQLWSPYQDFLAPSRFLLEALLPVSLPEINLTDGVPERELFRDQMLEILQRERKVRLSVRFDQLPEVRPALTELLNQPVEQGFELFYPSVEKVENHGTDWSFELRLQEDER